MDTSDRKVQIHGFADASRKAYCAVVYLVYDVRGERQVRLLCSKTRVAPLKEMTIPRLELMAALILARLVSHVKEALGTLIEVEREVYWSDRKTVLYWLANKGEWKQFVKHRVDEILQLTRNGEWRHCPGEQNPVDIGSRGALACKLKSSALLWNGPHWLTGHEQGWPALQIQRTPAGAEEEKGTWCKRHLSAVADKVLGSAQLRTRFWVPRSRGQGSGFRAVADKVLGSAQLRTRFWVPKGRQVVKKIVHRCVTCKKLEGRAYAPPPVADLPGFRVTQAEPFSKVGVDFAGPLYYKSSTGMMQNAYVALFSCCVTLALHLDLVVDLEACTFRRSLRRFAARKGAPTLIVSDNAKTFKAAAKALKELYDHPERRLHGGVGFYERMVGSVKRCLRKTLGEARLTYDELITVLVEVESTLNDRPLTYVYDEVGEVELIPAHLMYGRRLNSFPDELVEPDDVANPDHNSRFRYVSAKLSHFWKRWSKEYLASFREFHRSSPVSWHRETVQVGDVVTVHEDGSKRSQWKMATISPGQTSPETLPHRS
ncbi:uncharacterized protein LOC125558945 [Nematostella vectensis]|uniref:uncharacterized protein LOC125558945 n=1 Tax=Nematostella vectensis TaxID=45351 RepID=UPI00207759E0|nr:uncharacterized protein LOC125558945 [Nematostella vectensis]